MSAATPASLRRAAAQLEQASRLLQRRLQQQRTLVAALPGCRASLVAGWRSPAVTELDAALETTTVVIDRATDPLGRAAQVLVSLAERAASLADQLARSQASTAELERAVQRESWAATPDPATLTRLQGELDTSRRRQDQLQQAWVQACEQAYTPLASVSDALQQARAALPAPVPIPRAPQRPVHGLVLGDGVQGMLRILHDDLASRWPQTAGWAGSPSFLPLAPALMAPAWLGPQRLSATAGEALRGVVSTMASSTLGAGISALLQAMDGGSRTPTGGGDALAARTPWLAQSPGNGPGSVWEVAALRLGSRAPGDAELIPAAWSWTSNPSSRAWDWARGGPTSVWSFGADAASAAWGWTTSLVGGLAGAAFGHVRDLLDAARGVAGALHDRLVDVWTGAQDWVVDTVGAHMQALADAASSALSWLLESAYSLGWRLPLVRGELARREYPALAARMDRLSQAQLAEWVAGLTADELEHLARVVRYSGLTPAQRQDVWSELLAGLSADDVARVFAAVGELGPRPSWVSGGSTRHFEAVDLRELPLFDDGAQHTDFQQGRIGDCYLAAAIMELARWHPELIEQMIAANANGTYTVTFADGHRVTVLPQFPAECVPGGDCSVVSQGGTDGGEPTELWALILQLAVAQRGSSNERGPGWDAIQGGSSVAQLEQFVGFSAQPNVSVTTIGQLGPAFIDRVNACPREEMLFLSVAWGSGRHALIIDRHDTDTGEFLLINPHDPTEVHAMTAHDILDSDAVIRAATAPPSSHGCGG